MADGLLPNEQLNSNSGFCIPLDSSTTFPAEDLTGPPPCYDTNGDPIYIGSAIFKRSVLPCKIGPHLSIPCLVPYHNREMAYMGHYDLLPFNPHTMEFVRTSYGSIPGGSRPVEGGYEEDMTPLYHGIAVVRGIRLPGTIRRHQTGCNVNWGGSMHLVHFDYEILCVQTILHITLNNIYITITPGAGSSVQDE
ncbi:hypothetical protein EDD85DRAFT_782324 [Armillaria nabsnona]|nr:hypothetical protein EDD85DRAFT_782324 [Armillaria nabsnona]